MTRYHVNPKTGRPNICRAATLCPFGGSEAHFASKEEARTQYEASMKTAEVPTTKGKGGAKKAPAKRKLSPKDQEMLAIIRAHEAARGKSMAPAKEGNEQTLRAQQVTAFNELLQAHRERGLEDPVPPLLKQAFTEGTTAERQQVLEEFQAYDRHVGDELESYRPALAHYQERFLNSTIGGEGTFVSREGGFMQHQKLSTAPEALQLAWIRQRVQRMAVTARAYRFLNGELRGKRSIYSLGRSDAKRLVEDAKFAQAFLGSVRTRLAYENHDDQLYSSEQARFDRLVTAIEAGDARQVRAAYSELQSAKTMLYWRDDHQEYQKTRAMLGAAHPAYRTSDLTLAAQAHLALARRAQAAEAMYEYVDAQWTPLSQDRLRQAFSPKMSRGHDTFDRFVEAHDHAMEARSRGATIGFSKAVLGEFTDRVETMRDAWFSLPKDL